MNWDQVVEKITPYVVKISTPDGHGTGFLCLYNEGKTMCGIATAHHVVAHADEWQQPLRITCPFSNTSHFAKESDRVILTDPNTDSAVILLFQHKLALPEDLIPLLPSKVILPIGADVGWLGFPGVDPHTLCFFSGNVSARKSKSYLIDGVAINGVSGGPVIYSTPSDGVQIVGAISAYMPNRTGGGTLPGLCIAQDVSHFNLTAGWIKDRDEANRAKQSIQQQAPTSPMPTEDEPPSEPKQQSSE